MSNQKRYTKAEIEFIRLRISGHTLNECSEQIKYKRNSLSSWSGKFKEEITLGKKIGFNSLSLPEKPASIRQKPIIKKNTDQLNLFEPVNHDHIKEFTKLVKEIESSLIESINELKEQVNEVFDYIKAKEEEEESKATLTKKPVKRKVKQKPQITNDISLNGDLFDPEEPEVLEPEVVEEIVFTADLKAEIKEKYQDGLEEEELAEIYKVEIDDIYDIIDEEGYYFTRDNEINRGDS